MNATDVTWTMTTREEEYTEYTLDSGSGEQSEREQEKRDDNNTSETLRGIGVMEMNDEQRALTMTEEDDIRNTPTYDVKEEDNWE